MINRNIQMRLTFITAVLFAFFLVTIPVFADNLKITPDNTYLEYDEALGGFILNVKASPGIGSILITESSADPDGELDVFAYRAEYAKSINKNEKRILNGSFLKNNGEEQYLIDSTPEPDSLLGEAFRILIPYRLAFGYPWSRNGVISVGRGTWLNIRSFEKPYADYHGAWRDNAFTVDTNLPVVDEKGFTREITDMIPDEIMERIEESGMTIYTGDNPPTLEGTFFVSPMTLISSTIASDSPEDKYNDYNYSFSKQNNYDLTIEVTEQSEKSRGDGTGGFIVGQDGKFTIFVEISEKKGSEGWSKTATIISGELTKNGIINFQSSLVMLENSGTGDYIDVGEGRLFHDGDGFSEKIE